jgi:hypothetical protein
MSSTTPMSPAKRFVATRAFPWLVVLAGAAAAWVGVDGGLRAGESTGWPAVPGTVVRSSVQEERSTTRSGPPTVTHRPVVVYRYEVNGTPHEGQRIAFGEYATGDPADAAQVIARYPAGGQVSVHYRPDDPGQAVLEPGGAGLPWLLAGIGVLFALVGVVLVVVTPRLARSA